MENMFCIHSGCFLRKGAPLGSLTGLSWLWSIIAFHYLSTTWSLGMWTFHSRCTNVKVKPWLVMHDWYEFAQIFHATLWSACQLWKKNTNNIFIQACLTLLCVGSEQQGNGPKLITMKNEHKSPNYFKPRMITSHSSLCPCLVHISFAIKIKQNITTKATIAIRQRS